MHCSQQLLPQLRVWSVNSSALVPVVPAMEARPGAVLTVRRTENNRGAVLLGTETPLFRTVTGAAHWDHWAYEPVSKFWCCLQGLPDGSELCVSSCWCRQNRFKDPDRTRTGS